MGMSDTTFLFLKEASKKREFQVGLLTRPRCDATHSFLARDSCRGMSCNNPDDCSQLPAECLLLGGRAGLRC